MMYRQGDVLMIAIPAIPGDATPCTIDGDVILAYGEVTGHAHRFAPDLVKAFAKGGVWSPGAERYIRALEGATLRHEEHASIVLPPGNYRVVQQREYTPQEIRNVAD